MKELARILKGSQNYNLAGPDSDYDYISIIVPSLTELYYNKTFNTKNEHLSLWTLPMFTKRFLSADPTALELCFSSEAFYHNNDFYDFMQYLCQQLEDGFLRSVWPQYCNRMFGMMYSDLKNAQRTDWEIKRRLKVISRAIYFLDLMISICNANGCMTKSNYRTQIHDRVPHLIKFTHDASNLEEDIKFAHSLINTWKPTIEQRVWSQDTKEYALTIDTMAIDIMRKFIK